MGDRARLLIGSLVALTLAGAQLSAGSGAAGSGPTGGPPGGDPDGVGAHRLAADATAGLSLGRDARGRVVFAGVRAGEQVDNPSVTSALSVSAAADAHLRRYGPAFGVPASTFSQGRTTRTVSGQDTVRYTQKVGGVPVLGGEVVLSLRPGRELGSMLATVSHASSVARPVVGRSSAAATARAAALKRTKGVSGLRVTGTGRWVFDPAVFGAPAPLGARTVWREEVRGGPGVRRLVLVDDQTGAVLLDLDLIQQIDRVICDAQNLPADPVSCTSNFARVEGGPASGVSEVNKAFDLSGAVSTFYQQIGGIDLTQALGIDVLGVKKLASTVRLCPLGEACPFANAFWDGTQMFYGDTYAGADDVVGHEMTHGIIDQNSQLFYWFQSGAINESIADIMGEIVDHRNPSAGDTPGDWRLGEDLPIGAIRDLQTPSASPYLQPDRMTSPLYTADSNGYGDNGGVHTNSGVGNKTAYLISQGGTFNGQTITGIDTGDATLTKTAKLYLDVIARLTSGSDYADLARVLDQSCQDFIGTSGFTAADCTNVHKATLATQLTTTPTKAPQPADARATCPTGTQKRALFDSETGTPGAKFAAGANWVRAPNSNIPSNATSGSQSWFSYDPPTAAARSLRAATGIRLPAGQKSYLWFQHWRLLEYEGPQFYDGGTVEVDDLGTRAGPVTAARLPWVNGPGQTLFLTSTKAFGGDSRGWIASRVDLSSYAGKSVKPQFTMRTDNSGGAPGWFLDDIRVYTCTALRAVTKPTVSGTTRVGKALTARPGTWTPTGVRFAYQWLRSGKAVAGARAKTYTLKAADRGKRMSVRVTGSKAGFRSASATSARTGIVR